jgi:exosortase
MILQSDRCPAGASRDVKAGRVVVTRTLSWYLWYRRCKSAGDFLTAMALLVLTAPLILMLMALVKLTSRGPAIYTQVRLGREGRPFLIYKIRTMAHDCERITGPRWSHVSDPRVTPLGGALRRLHLDELPQLWNIVRGEMSLVGPRPERPEFISKLELAIPRYRERLTVRPGITGLAQVQLPPDVTLDDVRRKVACDLYYVEQMGPWLDTRIMIGTGLKVLGIPFGRIRRLLGLSGPVPTAGLGTPDADERAVTQLQPTGDSPERPECISTQPSRPPLPAGIGHIHGNTEHFPQSIGCQMTTTSRPSPVRNTILLSLLGAGLLWAWWPSLGELALRWARDPRYSHGYLVPLFAAYLLWMNRKVIEATPLVPNGWGLVPLAAGVALRLAGARYFISWFEAVSLLPTLAGIAMLLGGWRALRWSGPSIGFLFFMIPLPYRVEMALGYPLQRVATLASNFSLQTLGLPAVAEGNIILLNEHKIGVVEACNGLGMLIMFFAFTVGTVLVSVRTNLERFVLIASSVPIAIAVNVARITVTGVLFETAGSKVADAVYHDLAGWLMMPMALAAIWAELFLLNRLLIDAPSEAPLPLDLSFIPAGQKNAMPRDLKPHPSV